LPEVKLELVSPPSKEIVANAFIQKKRELIIQSLIFRDFSLFSFGFSKGGEIW
jgi:hypothetical protein